MTRMTSMLGFGAALTLLLTACGGGDPSGNGGGGSGGGTGTTTGSATTSTSGSTTKTPNGTSYATDAQPIYQKHCASCHTTGNSGGVNFAMSYADTQKAPNTPSCAGVATVGECTIIRIKKGEMPFGAGCSGDPATDAANSDCLTQAEQDKLELWIDGGEAP